MNELAFRVATCRRLFHAIFAALLFLAPVMTKAQATYAWKDVTGRTVYSQFRPGSTATEIRVLDVRPKSDQRKSGGVLEPGSTLYAASAATARPEWSTAHIRVAADGVYTTAGRINDKPVVCVIDTGASVVTINLVTAMRLGLNSRNGEQVRVTTAAGVVDARRVVLDSISVGEIRLDNVEAIILNGLHPENVLLGMSFLRKVEISQHRGEITLSQQP